MAATATLKTRSIQGESLPAAIDRLVNTALIYEGVIMRKNEDSFKVFQNLGTDMNIKIGSTQIFDRAVIQGDSVGQGVFVTEHQNASQVLAIAASDPTNDRIDIAILRIYDDTFDSSGFDYADLEVITGTPDASPLPPTVPAGSFVLAEILVQDAVTQIVNGDITDKRIEAPRHGELVKTIYYTANDTFTKADHPWLHKVRIRIAGGGGGGGAATNIGFPGGGGGGGGYSEKEVLEDDLGTTETVTIGAGGVGGIGGGAAATNGGNSSFGSHSSGNGGTFGVVNGGSGPSPGGTGSGDLALKGQSGDAGEISGPSNGGSSHLGFGGRIGNAPAVGNPGELYGGGGSGGTDNTAADRDGGAGAAGIVIVDLYA